MSSPTVRVFTSFAELPDDVRLACSVPSTARFQLSSQWFENLYREVFDGETKPRIYVSSMPSTGAIAALFCHTDHNSGALRSLTNFYSLEFGLSGNFKSTEPHVEALISHIAGEKWSEIDLRLLAEESEFKNALELHLQQQGFALESFFQYENWYRLANNTHETFEQYYAARPSRTKNTIKRKGNKLEREHAVRIEVIEQQGSKLDAAIDDYTKVYNRSWKKTEPFASFMPSMIRMAARLEILSLGLLYVDNEPAAAQLWLNEEGRAVIYKLAYDEAFKHLSVGSILSRRMFEHAFKHGHAHEIDYGVGSEGYKKEWLDSVRNLVGVEAFNRRSFRGQAKIMLRSLKRVFKKWLPARH